MTELLTLHPIADRRDVVERLWQPCCHDLRGGYGRLPGPDGLYPPGRLPSFFDSPDRTGYLALLGEVPVGFAMLRGIDGSPVVVSEFSVIRAARRRGTGFALLHAVAGRHPGAWEVPFQPYNEAASAFWRAAATRLVGDDWTEEPRPVPGRPEAPDDHWICFNTSGSIGS